MVPWIRSFQEITSNGNIENQVEIAIKRLSLLGCYRHVSFKFNALVARMKT